MARKKVVTVDMMKVRRAAPKSPFLGWGYEQTRKTSTDATSPRLLSYRSCVAGSLAGKEFASLKEVQEAFQEAAGKCKIEAEKKPTVPKE